MSEEDFFSYVGRLATFQQPHHLPKRRASSTKKKASSTLSWPHATPTPEELAYAGFYFKPSSTNPDNVRCYLCHTQLDGWEPGDNPSFEHLTHSPDCGWAINQCIRLRNGDPNRVEDDPMSERMIAARRATFMDKWPHEGKKAWRCKVQKMVEAGWIYDPAPDVEDGVTCCYCNLSLDGWEPKDNPMDEHLKRSPDCYFFALTEEYSQMRKAPRTKKARGSKASKTSRLSTQSNMTAFSEAPSLMSLGDDALPADEDSVLTTATAATGMTNASTAGKTRKGRAKGTTTKATKKTTRGKKNAINESSVMDDSLANGSKLATDSELPSASTRTTRRAAAQADSTIVDTTSVLESESVPSKPKRGRQPKAKAKASPDEDESQLQSELLDAVGKSGKADVPRAPRGTKRTSLGVPKADASTLSTEAEPAQVEEKPKTRGRKLTKKDDARSLSDTVQTIDDSTADTEVAGKGKRGRKPKAQQDKEVSEMSINSRSSLGAVPESPLYPNISSSPAPAPEESDNMDAEPHRSSSKARSATPQLPSSSRGDEEQDQQQEVQEETQAEAADAEQDEDTDAAQQKRVPTPDIAAPEAPIGSTPSPSPQPSDAENMPPSSRPISMRPPLSAPRSAMKAPMAEATTPFISPSKRPNNRLGGALQSAYPWEPIDLESVFVPSPSTVRIRNQLFDTLPDSNAFDKENLTGLPLHEVIKKVKEGLTTAEKKMTVEEWIYFNAKRSEERLRNECERMVGLFEAEGTRALKVLEAIECEP